MKALLTTVILLLLSAICEGQITDISREPDILYRMQQLKVKTLSTSFYSADNDRDRYTAEWQFSEKGKLETYRLYRGNSNTTDDPYPVYPDSVTPYPTDSVVYTSQRGIRHAYLANYNYIDKFGIGHRSYTIGEKCCYEMQYAFDADSNVIYYRSNMNYAGNYTCRSLEKLIRYDSLGNITKGIDYVQVVCEPCASWFPQFDTVGYRQTVYNYREGTATTISWSRHTDHVQEYFEARGGYETYERKRPEPEEKHVTVPRVLPLSRKQLKEQEKAQRKRIEEYDLSRVRRTGPNTIEIDRIITNRNQYGETVTFTVEFRE